MAVYTGILYENDEEVDSYGASLKQQSEPRKYQFVWANIILYVYLHFGSVYAIYLMFTSAKWASILSVLFFNELATFGVTCGGHRLWSHRSYKVKLPLKLLLLYGQTLAFQNSAVQWARDHRVHHKFTETNADPHNAARGFFYSHMGWTMIRKHPDVLSKGKGVDVSDLLNDPVLRFQHKYYFPIMIIIAFVIPVSIPMYFWGESFTNAWYLNFFRYCIGLHIAWLVNSAAHLYGAKTYDRFIYPSNNKFASFFTNGEGWHNYHHVFPWDYKASEFGTYSTNLNTGIIDFFAKIGWAYDLKTVSPEMVKKRVLRTGDGTHHIWGWKDKDMLKEDIQDALIINKRG